MPDPQHDVIKSVRKRRASRPLSPPSLDRSAPAVLDTQHAPSGQSPASSSTTASTSNASSESKTEPPPPPIWHAEGPPPPAAEYWIYPEYAEALDTGNKIIREVRRRLPFGSSNQRWNFGCDADTPAPGLSAFPASCFLVDHGHLHLPEDELRRYVNECSEDERRDRIQRAVDKYFKNAAEQDETDAAKSELKRGIESALGDPNSTALEMPQVRSALDVLKHQAWYIKPRLRAHAALAVQAGLCDQMMAVSYMLARERFGPEYLVQLGGISGHAFCRVGKPHWPEQYWVAIDPWPSKAYALLIEHHLSFGKKYTVYFNKPGKGHPASPEQEARYARLRGAIEVAYSEFKKSWHYGKPDLSWSGMHNCLYPTPPGTSYMWRYPVYAASHDSTELATNDSVAPGLAPAASESLQQGLNPAIADSPALPASAQSVLPEDLHWLYDLPD